MHRQHACLTQLSISRSHVQYEAQAVAMSAVVMIAADLALMNMHEY